MRFVAPSLAAALLVSTSCAHERGTIETGPPPPPPRLSVDAVARAVPDKVKDRRGWAQDTVAVLDGLEVTPLPVPVCEVLAVVEQESGFAENPVVPNLPSIVEKKLSEVSAKLGPVGRPALNALLQGTAPSSKKTFAERLKSLKTERDLDIWFRELLAYYEAKYPKMFAAADLMGEAFGGRGFSDLNPITTAGSMQVSVRWSTERGKAHGDTEDVVRDALYTRKGGLYYGAARLLGYQAGYDDATYRFADYNAGVYASRNAAVQEQLGELLGRSLVTDGDLLAYDKAGEVVDTETKSLAALLAFRASFAPELTERQVKKDALKEKTLDFESTATWKALKRVYVDRLGKQPRYARIPDVQLQSPKLSRTLSTRWFAENVKKRFDRCMQRVRG